MVETPRHRMLREIQRATPSTSARQTVICTEKAQRPDGQPARVRRPPAPSAGARGAHARRPRHPRHIRLATGTPRCSGVVRPTTTLTTFGRRGAAPRAIIVHQPASRFGWDTVVNSWSTPQLDTRHPGRGRCRRGDAGSGRVVAGLRSPRGSGPTRGVPRGAVASTAAPRCTTPSGGRVRTMSSPCCQARSAGQYLVYMAHWDHLGACPVAPATASSTAPSTTPRELPEFSRSPKPSPPRG